MYVFASIHNDRLGMESTNKPSAPRALGHVRVVDLTSDRGEVAGRILADLGAEVVKVEVGDGSPSRRRPPFSPDGRSLYWAAYGRGKQTVRVDSWDDPRLWSMLAGADIVLESDAPGIAEARGYGYSEVAKRNPAAVYVAISPFGQDGPRANELATELTVEAAGGLTMLTGDGDRPPLPVGFPQAWLLAGATAAADSLVALLERDRSGLGQFVDVSAQACVVWTLMNATAFPSMVGKNPPGQCESRAAPKQMAPGVPGVPIFKAADGWVFLGLHIPGLGERLFKRILDWAAEEGLLPVEVAAHDWSSWLRAVSVDKRIDDVNAALEAMRAFVATKTRRELYRWGLVNGGLVAPVNEIADLLIDEHLAARNFWRNVGADRTAGPFAIMSETPLLVERAAKDVGADSAPAWTPRESDGGSVVDASGGTGVMRPGLTGGVTKASGRSGSKRPGALEGLKVADFSWVGVGPIIGRALADHGATVIRVESGRRPDALRTLPPFKDGVRGLNRAQFSAIYNTSKFGLALDLSTDDGREVGRRVADWADVVLESFTAGTIDRMGLGYETLQRDRGDLVMLSTSMRGLTGPDNRFAGFGNHGAALSGFAAITGWGDRPPTGPWGAYTDFITPRFGVAAIAAALRYRADTGIGQHIDLSQSECGIQFLEPLVMEAYLGAPAPTLPLRSGSEAIEGVERYRAVDGDASAELLTPMDLHADPQLQHRGFWANLDHEEIGMSQVEGLASIFHGTETGPHWAGPTIGQHTDHVLRNILGMTDAEIEHYTPVLA